MAESPRQREVAWRMGGMRHVGMDELPEGCVPVLRGEPLPAGCFVTRLTARARPVARDLQAVNDELLWELVDECHELFSLVVGREVSVVEPPTVRLVHARTGSEEPDRVFAHVSFLVGPVPQ